MFSKLLFVTSILVSCVAGQSSGGSNNQPIVVSTGNHFKAHCQELTVADGKNSAFWKSFGWRYESPVWSAGGCDRTKWNVVDKVESRYQNVVDVVMVSYGIGAPKPPAAPANNVVIKFENVDFNKLDELVQTMRLVGGTSHRVVDSVGGSASFSNCGTASDKGKITSGVISPNPIVKGQNIKLTGSGQLLESVTAGTYTVTITYNGLTILSHTHSLCGDDSFPLPLGLGTVKVQGIPCPSKPGPVTITQIIPYPLSAPAGAIKAHVTAKDSANQQLMCFDLNMNW